MGAEASLNFLCLPRRLRFLSALSPLHLDAWSTVLVGLARGSNLTREAKKNLQRRQCRVRLRAEYCLTVLWGKLHGDRRIVSFCQGKTRPVLRQLVEGLSTCGSFDSKSGTAFSTASFKRRRAVSFPRLQDLDKPSDFAWLCEAVQDRAKKFHIDGASPSRIAAIAKVTSASVATPCTSRFEATAEWHFYD